MYGFSQRQYGSGQAGGQALGPESLGYLPAATGTPTPQPQQQSQKEIDPLPTVCQALDIPHF